MEQPVPIELNSVEDAKQLRRHIAELQCRVQKFDNEYGFLHCDDIIEYLIIARSSAMNDKIKDAVKCTAECFRKISDKNEIMRQILTFFEGKTSTDKKNALRDFLKENPAFRTTSPELLLQRLKLKNKFGDYFESREIPLNPIKEAIDEFNALPPE